LYENELKMEKCSASAEVKTYKLHDETIKKALKARETIPLSWWVKKIQMFASVVKFFS
jgi:hypothetical protein